MKDLTKEIFTMLFLLTDARYLLRTHKFHEGGRYLPRGELMRILVEIKESLKRVEDIIERDDYLDVGGMDIVEGLEVRTIEEEYININPIQVGGRLTPEAMKAIIAYADGYSVCDWCLKPFRLDRIRRPQLERFHKELAEFIGMREARLVPGARRGFQAVINSVARDGIVVVSSLAHYTEYLAAEEAGAKVYEIPVGEDNVLRPENLEEKITEIKRKIGEEPDLVIVDHVDYQYGNLHPIRDLSRVAHEHGIPVLCNCAYTLGIMPVDGRKLEVDFIVGSGHKSFSSPAPSGILGIGDDYVEKVLSGSRIRGDVSGRTYPNKETSILGCTLMGCTAVAMMASFPRVKERVRRWGEEVEKANHFCQQFLRIAGNGVLSEMPRRHTLICVDTRESFDKIARGHKRRGYFLYEELRNRGITGIFPGATRIWKLNTYGLSWDEVRYLSETFIEIAKKYGIEVQ